MNFINSKKYSSEIDLMLENKKLREELLSYDQICEINEELENEMDKR